MSGPQRPANKRPPSKRRDLEVTRKLSRWFERSARELPWRRYRPGGRCPWGAFVAEAMLQQTQVARVIERYVPFMQRFPTPADLAAADEQEVLVYWQGLGYYRRARHLHQAARMIVERFAGVVPDSTTELLSLPGVGRYTAGAIASIVFHHPEPIVDGNVRRVLARLEAHRDAETPNLKWTWQRAEALVRSADAPGTFNEALMELGSTICTPHRPDCVVCPIATHCIAKRKRLQDEIPPPQPPPKQTVVHHHALIIRSRGKLLIEQRPEQGLWAGMWQVPTLEETSPLQPSEVVMRLRLPIARSTIVRSGRFEHQTSHRRITFHIFSAAPRNQSTALQHPKERGTTHMWSSPSEAIELPMSNAQRRIIREFAAAGETRPAER